MGLYFNNVWLKNLILDCFDIVFEDKMIISQLSIAPFGKDVSVSKYVKKVIKIISKYNVNYETNAMSTVFETEDIETIFKIIQESHILLKKNGAQRIITELKIDDRQDKNATMQSKLNAIQ